MRSSSEKEDPTDNGSFQVFWADWVLQKNHACKLTVRPITEIEIHFKTGYTTIDGLIGCCKGTMHKAEGAPDK